MHIFRKLCFRSVFLSSSILFFLGVGNSNFFLIAFKERVAVARQPRISATFTKLADFKGGNGANPVAGLIQANDGNFYGTTQYGGSTLDSGTVFRVTPSGEITKLLTFYGKNGQGPVAPLLQASDGNFYGTTAYGGKIGLGTAFRMTPTGQITTIFNFSEGGITRPDGIFPSTGLIQTDDGDLWGTTSGNYPWNLGTVFRISGGSFNRVVVFKEKQGVYPSKLLHYSDGNFYGTAPTGGLYGKGTIFRMTLAGSITVLKHFRGGNGAYPAGALILGNDGNFYGMTGEGGITGCGTVFRMTPSALLTTVVNFRCDSVRYPADSLIQANDGNFYGIGTKSGPTIASEGAVFQMTPSGVLTTLHIFSFSSPNGGLGPTGTLVQGSDGDLYGVANNGGIKGKGTIFKLTLAP